MSTSIRSTRRPGGTKASIRTASNRPTSFDGADVVPFECDVFSTSRPGSRPAATWHTVTCPKPFARRLVSSSLTLSGFGSTATTQPSGPTRAAESIVK